MDPEVLEEEEEPEVLEEPVVLEELPDLPETEPPERPEVEDLEEPVVPFEDEVLPLALAEVPVPLLGELSEVWFFSVAIEIGVN